MTDKKIKRDEEVSKANKLNLEVSSSDVPENSVLHTLGALLQNANAYIERVEAAKSPEQKAREREASAALLAKSRQEKALKKIQARKNLFTSWCKHDTWVIETEALPLLMCRNPKDVTFWEGPTKEIADLVNSCAGHSLPVVNLQDSKSKWRVKPHDWVMWAKSKGHPIPPELNDVLFPKLSGHPSLVKATGVRELNKRDRQRHLRRFAHEISEQAKIKGIAWDNKSIPITKAEFLDAFYSKNSGIKLIEMTTFNNDIKDIGLKFKPGTKTKPNNILVQILK